MEPGAQAVFFFLAFVAFVVATIAQAIVTPKSWWHILVSAGLAAWVFVSFWIAVKA